MKMQKKKLYKDDVNLLKNKKLSRSIHESCFYMFKTILKSKASMYGNLIVEADPFFPSTQKCSCCGYVKTKTEKLTLKDRIYSCNNCGSKLDRDYNAALNLRNLI